MGAMQKMILGRIKTIVEKRGFEFRENLEWANYGRVYVGVKGSFHNVMAFAYDFQDSYCGFNIFDGRTVPVGGNASQVGKSGCVWTCCYMTYGDADRLEAMITFIYSYLQQFVPPEPKRQKSTTTPMTDEEIHATIQETIDFLEEKFPHDNLPEIYDRVVRVRDTLAQRLPTY